jgi:hypothetical protein
VTIQRRRVDASHPGSLRPAAVNMVPTASGVHLMMNGYHLLDLTALGRQEEWEEPKGRTLTAYPANAGYPT